jgi:hypothetical protein
MLINKSLRTPWCVIINILLVFLCYEACRLTFLFENRPIYGDGMTWPTFWKISKGGLLFDSSAIFYTNCLYLLLVFFPLHIKETAMMRNVEKWLFVIVNAVCIVANLMDTVYFQNTEHRADITIFREFGGEGNLLTIFCSEIVTHWYLLLIAIVLIAILWVDYVDAMPRDEKAPLKTYYIRNTVLSLITIPIMVLSMRGWKITTATRPIAVGNAMEYVSQPAEAGIVLNTPFCMIRTIGNMPESVPRYFATEAELEKVYTPVHIPDGKAAICKKNVVIIIVESFAKEFVGALNKDLDGGTYKGYTTFTDSLIPHCTTFSGSFANSSFSIDAMPAVLASIPRMDRPFVLSSYALNKTNSIPQLLKRWNYHTAFFHGAENGSLGFEAYAKSIGFDEYVGRTEYYNDPSTGGKNDFDGTWGIWDEPFLQFFCQRMSKMKQPFMTTLFTLSSHHPFKIPDKYKNVYKDEGLYPLHKCIRYTDNALRQFFNTATRQPWYKNTIFVITADHASSKTAHAEYKTEFARFLIPILFYDPSGELKPGQREGIIQQIDIMPTLLHYLGYNQPYIAFGKDMLDDATDKTWAINWDHEQQLVKGNYVLQATPKKTLGIYNYRRDPLLRHNLNGKVAQQKEMENLLKAITQSYMDRMSNNKTFK